MIEPLYGELLLELARDEPRFEPFVAFLMRYERMREHRTAVWLNRRSYFMALPSWEIGCHETMLKHATQELRKGKDSFRAELKHSLSEALQELSDAPFTQAVKCCGKTHHLAVVRMSTGSNAVVAYPLDHPDPQHLLDDELLATLAGETSCFQWLSSNAPGWGSYWFPSIRLDASIDPYLRAIEELHDVLGHVARFIRTFQLGVPARGNGRAFEALPSWQIRFDPELLPRIIYGQALGFSPLADELRRLLQEHSHEVACGEQGTHRVALARIGGKVCAAYPIEHRHTNSRCPCVTFALELNKFLGMPESFSETWRSIASSP